MKVSLISYTPEADNLLIFTKQTRLTLSPGLLDEIRSWPAEKKLEELTYMSKTIPSSWEFADFTFLLEDVTRAFTHQCVRTRAASYAQQTMRLLKMEKFKATEPETIQNHLMAHGQWVNVMGYIQSTYDVLLNMGIPPEDARGILPTNIQTNIVCKYNLRTLSELCKSRTGGRTQGEYQEVANMLADRVIEVYPWAAMFLFPQGRHKFDKLEEAMKELMKTRPELAREGLKEIDLLRKD